MFNENWCFYFKTKGYFQCRIHQNFLVRMDLTESGTTQMSRHMNNYHKDLKEMSRSNAWKATLNHNDDYFILPRDEFLSIFSQISQISHKNGPLPIEKLSKVLPQRGKLTAENVIGKIKSCVKTKTGQNNEKRCTNKGMIFSFVRKNFHSEELIVSAFSDGKARR